MNNNNSGSSDRPTTITTTSAVEATKAGCGRGQRGGQGRG